MRIYVTIEKQNNRSSVIPIKKCDQEVENIKYPCYLLMDQSTETGYTVYDDDYQLIMSGNLGKNNASLEEYKYALKDVVDELIEEYKIKTIFYEEVYDKENMWTTEVLLYIKHAIKDIAYLNKEVEVFGVDHMTWKVKLASPNKFNTSNNHKKEVLKYVEGVYPLLFMDKENSKLTEHMVDALGMGIGLLVKRTRRGGFYDTVRFNKNLPIHQMILKVDEDVMWEEVVGKCRKPYRDAFAVGGVTELELNRRKGIGDLFRRYLTHKDALAVVRIPKDYKDWGILLLEHGKKPSELGKDKDFWLLSVRKKRK